MKTMEKLCERFNRIHPGYRATFHAEWQDTSEHVLWISSPDGECARYTFATCQEFRDWMDGVVLD